MTVTATTPLARVEPETAALLTTLNRQREHVLGILDGLPAEDLRRPVLPSGWTCLGLVQHLTLDVERFWFRDVVAGEPAVGLGDEESSAEAAEATEAWETQETGETREAGDDAWRVGPDVPAAGVLAAYRREIARADAVIAVTPLDAAPANWPARWSTWRLADLRAVLLHVITETACHAGHLDAVRELIDGRTWMVIS